MSWLYYVNFYSFGAFFYFRQDVENVSCCSDSAPCVSPSLPAGGSTPNALTASCWLEETFTVGCVEAVVQTVIQTLFFVSYLAAGS